MADSAEIKYVGETLAKKFKEKIETTRTALQTETNTRIESDEALQTQINAINEAQNCVDIVKTKEDLDALDVSKLELNDKVEVLIDSGEYEGKATIYNLAAKEGSVGTWTLVGPMGNYAMSSWKDWSENHNSDGVDEDVYIGDTNTSSDYKLSEALVCSDEKYESMLAMEQNALASYEHSFNESDSLCRFVGMHTEPDGSDESSMGMIIVKNTSDSATENDYYVTLGPTVAEVIKTVIDGETCLVGNSLLFKESEYGQYDGTTYSRLYYLKNVPVTKTIVKTIIRAEAYQFGKHNVINDGSSVQTTDPSITATNIGSYNTINGEGVNIGKKNTSSTFGITIGQNNNASDASLSIGTSASSSKGSLAYSHGYGTSTASSGSAAISIYGDSSAEGGSMAIAMTGKSSAVEGSISIGSNTSTNGGIAIAISGATASSGGTAIGRGASASGGGISLGTNGATASGGIAIGYSSTTANGGLSIGLEGISSQSGGITLGRYGSSSEGGSITVGIEGAKSSGGAISIGRSGNTATGGSLAVGTMNNKSDGESIAIGNSHDSDDPNLAINRSYAFGFRNNSADAAISIGSMQIASNSSIAIGHIENTNTIYAFVDSDGYTGMAKGIAYLPDMKLSMSVVKGTWTTSSTFVESSSGSSYAIKSAIGTYFKNYQSAILDSVTEITGNRSGRVYPSLPMGVKTPTIYTTYVTLTDTERSKYIRQVSKAKYSNRSIGNAITIGSNASADSSATAIYASSMDTGNCYKETISTTVDSSSGMTIATSITHTYSEESDNSAYANGDSVAIGRKTYATGTSMALNDHATASNGSISIGLASYGSTVNTASNESISIGFSSIADEASATLGQTNKAYKGSFTFGNNNTAYSASFVLGQNNTAGSTDNSSGWNIIAGYNNTANAHGHGILLGYSNVSYTTIGAYKDPKKSETVEPFSLVSGVRNTSLGRMNLIHGYSNQAGFTSSDTYDTITTNDGLCVAIGRENKALRNYDMALGYQATADGCVSWMTQTDSDSGVSVPAGGQNIAIHASGAHGATNIAAFNSDVYGISNIGLYDSHMNLSYSNNYSYLCTNRNVLFNSTTNMNATVDSSFADNTLTRVNLVNNSFEHFDRNTLKDSNLSLSSVKTFVDNIIYGNSKYANSTTTRMDITNTSSMVGNIIIGNNKVSAQNVETIVDNIAIMSSVSDSSNKYQLKLTNTDFCTNNMLGYNSTFVIDNLTAKTKSSSSMGAQNNILLATSSVNSESYSTNNNFLFASKLTANAIAYLPDYYASDFLIPSVGNVLFGTRGTDISEVVSFSYSEVNYDWTSSNDCILTRVYKSFNFGDNNVVFGAEDVLFGYQNTVKSAIHTTIVGNHNTLTGTYNDSTNTYMKSIDETVMLGSYNTITASQGSSRINVFGTYNTIIPESMGSSTDMLIVGSYNNAYGSTSSNPIKNSDRMTVFGSYNRLGSFTTDGFVFGAYNTVGNTTSDTSDIIYCNMYALGSYNTVKDGSNAMAIGAGNNSTGHHALSLGMQLNTNQFQTVIGKYNKALDGTNRYNTTEDGEYTPVDTTTGALFIVGNGYAEYGNESTKKPYNWNDETYIHRSNAMVVWANGSVEAKEFIVTVGDNKYKLSDILRKLDLSAVPTVVTDN